MKKLLVIFLTIIMSFSILTLTSCKDKHVHSYGEWVITVEATCTSPGSRSKSCSCGDVITQTIDPTGHNMVDGVCTECGARK